MRRLHIATFALALIGAAPPARTQPPVGEVVVHLPAPRVWKVSHGGSTLYIVGRIGLLPGGAQWNTAPVAKIMDHAERFIVPPYISMGASSGIREMLQPRGATLDGELSDERRVKLREVLARLYRAPGSLDRYKAASAAYELLSTLPGGMSVLADEPLATLRALAERKGLKVTEAYHGDGRPLLVALGAVPEDQGLAILDTAIARADDYLDHAAELDEAWRKGDLDAIREGMKHRPNPVIAIAAAAPEARAASLRQEEGRFLAAIEAALAQPGVTVTVYGVAELGPDGPLITRLRADGYEVTEPGS